MKPKAFTLVELLVVIAIIGILSSLIYVATNNAVNSGKDSKRKSDVALLASGIHVYSIGSELIASSGCNIGSTCSTEINDALTAQLGPLPSEPDSNKSYVYQSDGTDCTISAVLSDGQTYQYSCSQDAMTQSAPINGQCGSAVDHGSYTVPTSNFCSDGSTPTISGEGPWTWSCPGQYLGSSASCTAYKSIDGVCDAGTDGSSSYAPLSSNLCTKGTASSVSTGSNPTNYFTWACNGEHDGLPDSCSANLKVDGICGASNGSNYYLSSEITNACSPGTASSITTGSTAFTWTCAGVNEGASSGTCTANKKVDGVCGGANGGWYESAPTSSLCSYGTASASGSWSWTCLGQNGGTTSGTCTANQRLTCSAAGGYWSTCGASACCRIGGSSCPTGWSYTGYNSTSPRSFSDNGSCSGGLSAGPGGYCNYCGASSVCCYSASHTWTTTPNSNEYITYINTCSYWFNGNYYPGGVITMYSTTTEVGCQ